MEESEGMSNLNLKGIWIPIVKNNDTKLCNIVNIKKP